MKAILRVRALIEVGLTLFIRAAIIVYRYSLSYFLGRQCRFQPSCSLYADEAIRRYGPLEGSRLAVRRVCRCHPLGGHGYDPVP